MKHFLFIDNFRGFTDTCIPIEQVNFLVGENSTGKTSILGLLGFISNPNFLFRLTLDDEQSNFGNFSEMVSAHSSDRRYFHVGFVWESNSEKKTESKDTRGYLLTYTENNGLARLSRLTTCRGTERISLRFSKSGVQYKHVKLEAPRAVEEMTKDLRSFWLKEHLNDEIYQKLKLPSRAPENIPPFIALSLAMQQLDQNVGGKKTKNREDFSVFPPETSFSFPLCWVAPIRTKPKRTYDELTLEFSPEGAHTPYLIRRLLNSKSQTKKFRDFIRKVGEATGLFEDVIIKNFGRGATAPFEVDIVLAGKGLSLNTVGYGVSQSLPVLVELVARPNGSWFAIQQPEVHLHPRAQAALGDVFFEMATIDHKFFLIETHSDFMIDRFRMQYRNKRTEQGPSSQILFFERQESHNVVTVLPIGDSGELPLDQPESYRSFFLREQINLLGL